MQQTPSILDALNLAQTWLHTALYSYTIYPPQAFQKANAYGCEVYVASAPPLRAYLTQFFQQIGDQIQMLNSIELVVLEEGRQLARETFSMDFPQQNLYNNRHQRDIELKGFVNKMRQHFSPQYPGIERTFQLFVHYRVQNENGPQNDGKFVDCWVPQDSPIQGQQSIGGSLKLMDLNIILTRQQ